MIRSLFDISSAFFSYWVATSIRQNYVNPVLAQLVIGLSLFAGLYAIANAIISCSEKWTMRHLVCGISGTGIGLIFSNLLILPFYITTVEPSSTHAAAAACVSLAFMLAFGKLFVEFEPKLAQVQIIKNATENTKLVKILDTNMLIDGRISKLIQMRFLEGLITIPDFVLAELKKMADHPDEFKSDKGKHGLDTARALIEEYDHVVRYETDLVEDVDRALVVLARDIGGKIVTADNNLIKLAEAMAVPVINLHELAVAFQPVYLKGERMTVKIIEPGSHTGQGLAYTEDGTMIVVSKAAERIGEFVNIVITRHLQGKIGLVLFGDIL